MNYFKIILKKTTSYIEGMPPLCYIKTCPKIIRTLPKHHIPI